MNFISVKEFRINPGKIWNQLKNDKDIVVTSNGKPIAILNPIYDNDIEVTLEILQRFRALKAVEDLQAEAVKTGLDKMSDKEIDQIIKKVRQEHKK
jgi:antitoxin (DNA-binding transcriptional repressor) of toxin-antitoxin stability system